MAPKDPVVSSELPGVEVHPVPVKDATNARIIPIVPEPVKDTAKALPDAKKGKTAEAKKKVSSAAKVEASAAKVDDSKAAMEVKVVEVPKAAAEVPKVEAINISKVAAKKEVPSVTTVKAKVVKEAPSAAKVETKTMPTATKVVEKAMPTAVEVKAVPTAAKVVEKAMPTAVEVKAVPIAAKVEKTMPVAAKMEEKALPSVSKVEVKVPATPPAIAPISSMKSADVSAPPAVDDDIVIVKEIVAKKFGEMTFSDYNSAEDEDFSLSEAETEDSLEWSSETERTRAEDDLVEEKVGIDYVGAAIDIATEQAASFKIVQVGLAFGDWILGTVEGIATSEVAPVLSSIRRSARKIRRAGERKSGPFRPLGIISESTMTLASTFLSTPLALLGWRVKPVGSSKAKKVLVKEGESSEELCTFEELDLSDYDSDFDADYSPSEESSEDELEFCTDAAESSEAEDSESA